MARKPLSSPVKMAFEGRAMRIPIAEIEPLRLVSSSAKRTAKYAKIVASIREVGIIEPPVVARNRAAPGKFLLLDGHLRLEALKDAGNDHVVCLVSTDDEAFTYNKGGSRLAIAQE